MSDDLQSPLPHTPPGRLSQLLELGLASGRPWQPAELAAAWDYHLSAPLRFELSGLDADQARESRELLAEQGPLVGCLRALLRHPVPPVELLEMTKDFAKACLDSTDSPLPPHVAGVLYHTVIAVALTRTGERITRLSNHELARGFNWALAQEWIDPGSRATLEEARKTLDTHPT